MTIADLMSKAKEGDSDAYGELYENYLTPIFRYIYFRVKNKETAEDLTQTVFLRVLEKQGSFNTEHLAKAYFFRVAKNLVIDYWRKKKDILMDGKELNFVDAVSGQLPDRVDDHIDLILAQRVIDQLDESSREVIILKFINELSNQEIAKFLNKSESAVRQAQCRALKKMKKILEKYGNQRGG